MAISDFKGFKLNEVQQILDLNNIKPTIFTANNEPINLDKNYIIIDQKPLAGSILKLNNTKFLPSNWKLVK